MKKKPKMGQSVKEMLGVLKKCGLGIEVTGKKLKERESYVDKWIIKPPKAKGGQEIGEKK